MGCAFERVRTREVYLDEAGNALVRAAVGSAPLRHAGLGAAPLEVNPSGGETARAKFPPTLVRAISYIESNWSMANYATARGKVGPVLTSSGCAYGMMQVLTGMQPQNPANRLTNLQRLILKNHVANVQAGLSLLGEKWNYGGAGEWPYVEGRNPAILEDWYYAVWAYYAMFPGLNPANPDYPWPRPTYGSPACRNQPRGCMYSDYPYQELIMGMVANPPVMGAGPEGEPVYLWEAKPVHLPDRDLFVDRSAPKKPLWPPPVLPAPAAPTFDNQAPPRPALTLGRAELTLDYGSGAPEVTGLAVNAILNSGGGIISPNIDVVQEGPGGNWLSGWSLTSRVTPAGLLVSFDPSVMGSGEHTAEFRIWSKIVRTAPRIFTLRVCIDGCAGSRGSTAVE